MRRGARLERSRQGAVGSRQDSGNDRSFLPTAALYFSAFPRCYSLPRRNERPNFCTDSGRWYAGSLDVRSSFSEPGHGRAENHSSDSRR